MAWLSDKGSISVTSGAAPQAPAQELRRSVRVGAAAVAAAAAAAVQIPSLEHKQQIKVLTCGDTDVFGGQ